MHLRDRALIAAFAVLFISASLAALAPTAGSGAVAIASPAASAAGPRRYVEGTLGSATNASPFGARTPADRALVALLFRGLVRLGPGETIVGDLASSWETDPSGGQWTFHLRPGMRWQDGQPLNADDVVFTIDALADPGYTGPEAASWREVTATAVDPLTVTLKLATPLGGFLEAATQAIAPRHLLNGIAPANLAADPFGRHPVGSGAFRLVSLDPQHAVLDASDPSLTGLPAAALPGIEMRYFADTSSLRSAWDRGQLDAASELSPDAAAALGATPGAHLVRYPSSTLLAVVLNLRPAVKTFADPAVRRALLEAIDRQAVLASSLLGFGTTASSLVPPWATEFDAAASPGVPFDDRAAREGLTGAGWRDTLDGWIPKGASSPIQIALVSPDSDSNAVADATAGDVADAWQAIGLDTTHEEVPATSLVTDRLEPGRFEAAVVPLGIGLDPDLYPLLASSQTQAGGANVAGVQDAVLDKLLAAARAPGSSDSRMTAYRALEQRLSAFEYILPLAFRDDVVVLRNTVSGPAPRPVGAPGDRFWDVLTWRLADSPAPS